MKSDASKTLGKQTKKQYDTPRALQVGYWKHMQQPLSAMSYNHREFLHFNALPSFGRTQASTDKKLCNYVERGHLTRQCSLVLNRHRSPTLAKRSRTMIEEGLTK
jgi:hypothetical protein